MSRWVLATLLVAVAAYQDSGVRRASFWPMLPISHTSGNTSVLVNPETFNFVDASGSTSSSIPVAIGIYKSIMFPTRGIQKGARNFERHPLATSEQTFTTLEIWAKDPAARPPQPEEDESFTLSIAASGGAYFGRLQANTYVGVIRGLETLSQMLVFGVVRFMDKYYNKKSTPSLANACTRRGCAGIFCILIT